MQALKDIRNKECKHFRSKISPPFQLVIPLTLLVPLNEYFNTDRELYSDGSSSLA